MYIESNLSSGLITRGGWVIGYWSLVNFLRDFNWTKYINIIIKTIIIILKFLWFFCLWFFFVTSLWSICYPSYPYIECYFCICSSTPSILNFIVVLLSVKEFLGSLVFCYPLCMEESYSFEILVVFCFWVSKI